MSEFFLAVVNMSISASWIVLAVLILRLLLKKAPKWIAVLLWGIVALRLICPFSIESVLSLMPNAETINPEILVDNAPIIDSNIPVIDGVENPGIIGGGNPVIDGNPMTEEPSAPTPEASVTPLQTVIFVLSNVWLVGIAGMLAYTVISYFRVKGKIGTAVRLRENIFQSERVVSPFVLGIIKPKIYLPFHMDGQDMAYVIAHENAHIRRKDHWWKPIGFLILTLHWFNPLLWLGYVLLCRDIELACDEKVIKTLDFQQKADYSQALLNCSVNRRIIAACPLAFGEISVKDRVKSVLNYKKPAFWIIVVAIVASIVTAVCFLTNPIKEKHDTEQFFSEGFLLFDIGAESMESIESCTIIHYGNPTELILSEEDTLLFARYAYTDKFPVPEYSEIFTYPKTKRIKVVVDDRSVMLYLMQDGSIVVNHPGESFHVYLAEEQDVITPAKYAQLVAKCATEPTTPSKGEIIQPTDPSDVVISMAEKFLKGEISAANGDGRTVSIQDYLRSDYNKYALYDMSGDAVPELIIKTGEGLTIFSIKEQGLTVWYHHGTTYAKPLNNRAIFYARPGGAPEHTDYQYLVLDHNGEKLQSISFAEYHGNNAEYFINGEKVSKTAYEGLYKSLSLSDDAIVRKDILRADSVYAAFLNGYATDKTVLYFTKDIDNNGTDELFIYQNTAIEVYTYEGSVKKLGTHDFATGTLKLYHTQDTKYPGIVYVTVGGGKNHFGYITIIDGALSVKQTFDDDYGMISGKKEDVFYTDDEDLIALSKKVYQYIYQIECSTREPNTTEDPYAIREITDERVIKSGDKKLFNNGQFTLRFPNSWKCFTASGEDNVDYYFRDSVMEGKCQLHIDVTFAYLYNGKERTQEEYLKSFSRSYENVVIDSVTKETIRGYTCTKVVYSYTEDNTKFIGILYDALIEGPRFYSFRVRYPAEEKETYEKVFAYVLESIQFITADNGSISSLPLKEAYDHAVKMYVAGPSSKYRDVGELQIETGQIVAIDGKYYQSYVASNADIRYIWLSRSEFPDDNTALWDWYAVGSSQVYSLDLLGKVDEGRSDIETDKIDPDDMGLLSVVYHNSPFITQKGTTVTLNQYKPFYQDPEGTTYFETENVFVPRDYTFVDLDKDGKNELIVAEAPYADTYLILREEKGNIYGYSLPIRAFQSLKKDGSFQGSGGALINDYCTISFHQNAYQKSIIAKFHFESDAEKSVYEINGKQVSYEEIQQFAEAWENRPNAVWIKCN